MYSENVNYLVRASEIEQIYDNLTEMKCAEQLLFKSSSHFNRIAFYSLDTNIRESIRLYLAGDKLNFCVLKPVFVQEMLQSYTRLSTGFINKENELSCEQHCTTELTNWDNFDDNVMRRPFSITS